jgi:PHD/YefM family antitoxin component YafN of YafNO toxin-antitoxin module
MKTIRPSSDIRNHYQEISNQAKTERIPIYITVNGVGDTVVLNQQVYEEIVAELDLLRLLAEGESDRVQQRVHDGESVFDTLLKASKK